VTRSYRVVVFIALLAVTLGSVVVGIGEPGAPAPWVVVIDAGHGGEDPGALGQCGVVEKDLTLSVARLVQLEALSIPGIEIVLTRDHDVFVELKERAELANQCDAAVFVSLHANAFSDAAVRGVETLVAQGASPLSQRLAECLQQGVSAAVPGTKDRGVQRADLFLSRATMPAALVEMGFITNRAECEALQDLSTQRAIARAVLAGICAFLDGS
jgi:N-acetylmuramoyl-L-alanine amidase